MADNSAMRQTWTDLAGGWIRNERLFDQIYGPATEAILERAGIHPAQRVLDVGCGSGTLLERVVGLEAQAYGVDISGPMVEAARARVPEATVEVADAQTADLRGLAGGAAYDWVISRYGVMFFADPEAAFTNILESLAPGGRMVFACWRSRAENPVFTLGLDPLLDAMTVRPPMSDPDAPGPTAFADPERVVRLLAGTGWVDVQVEPFDFVVDYTLDGGDGVEQRLEAMLGTTGGEAARADIEPRVGPEAWAALLDEVRAAIRAEVGGGRVRSPGANWIVTAGSPRGGGE